MLRLDVLLGFLVLMLGTWKATTQPMNAAADGVVVGVLFGLASLLLWRVVRRLLLAVVDQTRLEAYLAEADLTEVPEPAPDFEDDRPIFLGRHGLPADSLVGNAVIELGDLQEVAG